MRLDDLDYELPPDLIAQEPVEPRDASRLLVVDRATGALADRVFSDLPSLLRPDDVVVVNTTRVIPARLRLRRAPGGAAEALPGSEAPRGAHQRLPVAVGTGLQQERLGGPARGAPSG
ncbi:MAG: S-adenosylmethionine:tRNA ribosyltransferase-isomerase [Actinomycetota bacterium]